MKKKNSEREDPLLSEGNTADSEEEGEDLVEDLEKIAKDYKKLKDDHYEADGLDEDVDEGDYEDQVAARLAADAELDRRNRLDGDVTKARLTRLPAVLEEDLDEGEVSEGCFVASAPSPIEMRFRRSDLVDPIEQ